MKRLITIACALFCANIYARTPKEVSEGFIRARFSNNQEQFVNNITTDEWRQIADIEIASGRLYDPSAYMNMIRHNRKNCEPLLNEYDGKFAATILSTKYFGEEIGFRRMPKCSRKYAEMSIGKNRPATAEVCKAVRGSLDSASLLQRIIVFAESYSDNKGYLWNIKGFDGQYYWVLISAPKALKKLIRKKGRSFLVGVDGRNPIQDAIDSLSAALNRPRMQGLKEWVAEWYPEYVWTEPVWMSEDRLKKLMDDIYFGQIEFNAWYQNILRANLGLEGYNEFVKKFNN